MEMQVYIANLGKYNEGELVGEWFTPPIDFEDVKERIGLNEEYEEYAIHDYELPFKIDEYLSLDKLNDLCEIVTELEGTPVYNVISDMIDYWFTDMEELYEHVDDIICYSNCDSMEDVARSYIEESGALGEVPNFLLNYIDYESLGRDMDLDGNFLVTNHGVFEYIN